MASVVGIACPSASFVERRAENKLDGTVSGQSRVFGWVFVVAGRTFVTLLEKK